MTARYIHLKTDWHDRITKKGYTEHFRWRIKDVGRPGHTKIRVAYPKDEFAKKLIGGRSSVVTTIMVDRKYPEDLKRILKLLRKQGHDIERVRVTKTGKKEIFLEKAWKKTWVNPHVRRIRGKLVRVRGHWRHFRRPL